MKNFQELKLPLHFFKNIVTNTGTILFCPDYMPKCHLETSFDEVSLAFGGVKDGKFENLYKEITSPLVFYVVDGMKSTVVRYVPQFEDPRTACLPLPDLDDHHYFSLKFLGLQYSIGWNENQTTSIHWWFRFNMDLWFSR